MRHRAVLILLALAVACVSADLAFADPGSDAAVVAIATPPDPAPDGSDDSVAVPDGFSDGTDVVLAAPDGFSDGADALFAVPDSANRPNGS